MPRKLKTFGAAVAVLAAVAVGSAAVAGAAQDGGITGGRGGHKQEAPLTGTTAAKVKEAALAKVKGATILRVETDSDSDSPYEAHVQNPDGSQAVLVDKAFKATSVDDLPGN